MKRKTLYYSAIVLISIFVITNFSPVNIQSATSGGVDEQFDTTTYMDTYNSNVTGWGTGQIELPRKNPEFQDLIKTSTTASNVYVDANFAYVGGAYDGFYIIDTSTPTSMSLTGYYNDSAEINWVYGSVVQDNKAYLANGADGLFILNVTDKSNPVKLGEADLPSTSLDIKIQGNFAYLPVYTGGIRVVDITSPTAPSEVSGYVNTSSDANGVAISGNYLYIAVHHAGLDVFDISTPPTPVFVSNVDLNGYARKVEISGNYAYVACDLGGLQIVDISDPTNMSRVVWLDGNTRYYGLTLDGSSVYVAGRSGMNEYIMRIYDISDPENPIAAGFYNLANTGLDVFVSGDYAYVAAGSAGLYSLKIAETGTPYSESYSLFAVAQSTTMLTTNVGEIISKVTLFVSETSQPENSLDYYLSSDGGANWEAVTVGVEHTFVNPGRYLKWKIELSTVDESTSPTVWHIVIDYTTIDVDLVLLYPEFGSYIQDQTPNFDWEDIPGTVGYLLQVSNSSGFTNLIVNESLIFHVSNYTLIDPLVYGEEYFWQVAYYIDFSTISQFYGYSTFIIDEEPVVPEFGNVAYVILSLTMVSISIVLMVKRHRKI
jgi:hypothetical protein